MGDSMSTQNGSLTESQNSPPKSDDPKKRRHATCAQSTPNPLGPPETPVLVQGGHTYRNGPSAFESTSRSSSSSPAAARKKHRRTTVERICKVCGDAAISHNFGVMTCESCKTFFRRNAHNTEKSCPFGGTCVISVSTRRLCTACRLNKCFGTGMNTDRAPDAEERQACLNKINTNRHNKRKAPNAKGEEADSEDNTSTDRAPNTTCPSSSDIVDLLGTPPGTSPLDAVFLHSEVSTMDPRHTPCGPNGRWLQRGPNVGMLQSGLRVETLSRGPNTETSKSGPHKEDLQNDPNGGTLNGVLKVGTLPSVNSVRALRDVELAELLEAVSNAVGSSAQNGRLLETPETLETPDNAQGVGEGQIPCRGQHSLQPEPPPLVEELDPRPDPCCVHQNDAHFTDDQNLQSVMASDVQSADDKGMSDAGLQGDYAFLDNYSSLLLDQHDFHVVDQPGSCVVNERYPYIFEDDRVSHTVDQNECSTEGHRHDPRFLDQQESISAGLPIPHTNRGRERNWSGYPERLQLLEDADVDCLLSSLSRVVPPQPHALEEERAFQTVRGASNVAQQVAGGLTGCQRSGDVAEFHRSGGSAGCQRSGGAAKFHRSGEAAELHGSGEGAEFHRSDGVPEFQWSCGVNDSPRSAGGVARFHESCSDAETKEWDGADGAGLSDQETHRVSGELDFEHIGLFLSSLSHTAPDRSRPEKVSGTPASNGHLSDSQVSGGQTACAKCIHRNRLEPRGLDVRPETGPSDCGGSSSSSEPSREACICSLDTNSTEQLVQPSVSNDVNERQTSRSGSNDVSNEAHAPARLSYDFNKRHTLTSLDKDVIERQAPTTSGVSNNVSGFRNDVSEDPRRRPKSVSNDVSKPQTPPSCTPAATPSVASRSTSSSTTTSVCPGVSRTPSSLGSDSEASTSSSGHGKSRHGSESSNQLFLSHSNNGNDDQLFLSNSNTRHGDHLFLPHSNNGNGDQLFQPHSNNGNGDQLFQPHSKTINDNQLFLSHSNNGNGDTLLPSHSNTRHASRGASAGHKDNEPDDTAPHSSFQPVAPSMLPADPEMYWKLTVEEQALIRQLTVAYKEAMTPIRPTEESLLVQLEYLSLQDTVTMVDRFRPVVLGFLTNFPDFRALHTDDQQTALKVKAYGLTTVFFSIYFCPTDDQQAALKAKAYVLLTEFFSIYYCPVRRAWLEVYGVTTLASLRHVFQAAGSEPAAAAIDLMGAMSGRLKSVLGEDHSAFALLACAVLFDPMAPGVRDRQSVNVLHDKYTTLLKHYLESRYSYAFCGRYRAALQDWLRESHRLAGSIGVVFGANPQFMESLMVGILNM